MPKGEQRGYKPPEKPWRRKETYTIEDFENGLSFAKSLEKKGLLASGEFSAIDGSLLGLKEGRGAGIMGSDLLKDWADRALFQEESEEKNAKTTRLVVEKFDRETAVQAARTGDGIGENIKSHLLALEKPTPQDAERILQLWRNFSVNVFAVTESVNLQDPQTLEAAIRMVNALLQPEPTREGEKDAREGIRLLKKRYRLLKDT